MLDRSNFSILVVDDNPHARYALARAIKASGFNVVEVANGSQALEMADYVSAVVLDVHLPDLHGMEVCRLLRARTKTARLPIIHVSAKHVTPEDKRAGKDAGADAYLVAPVDPANIVDWLDTLLDH